MLPSLDFTAMMLEFRMIGRQLPIVVDTDYQRIPFIVVKSVKVFLPPDLIHGKLRAMSVFQLNQQRGLLRILRF